MSTSIFEQVTSSLTVMSICGSLGPNIYEDTPLSELEDELDPGENPNFDPISNPSCVIDSNGNRVGILWFSDFFEEEEDPEIFFVKDVMRRPAPWQFLSSSTTILEAVQLMAKLSNEPFYVIHGNQLVGYLWYRHLFHPVGRLALLALALEIEEQALRLCQHPPYRQDAWQSISDSRRRKAIEVYRHRYGRESEAPKHIDRLIDCTQLADKGTMIWKRKVIPHHHQDQNCWDFSDAWKKYVTIARIRRGQTRFVIQSQSKSCPVSSMMRNL